MCTLIYLRLDDSPYHAALGLNRDEVYSRPSAPPRWWPPSDGDCPAGAHRPAGFVAPVDLVAGGTWFGLAETGLFVAITNGHQAGPFRHERSRGELVGDSLRRGDLEAALADLTARDAFAYAPCHLLLAQRDRVAYVAPHAAGRFAARSLGPGVHTLTNTGLDAGDTPPLLSPAPGSPALALESLRPILSSHTGPTARCRHGADRGTRSAALLLLGPDLPSSRLAFAGGPPCVTPFEEIDLSRHAVPSLRENQEKQGNQ